MYSGKRIGRDSYIHIQALGERDVRWGPIEEAERISGLSRDGHYNVIKLNDDENRITLLSYKDFFEDGFPELLCSWTIDLSSQSFNYRSYTDSLNPPVLHRKELLIGDNHPRYEEFQSLTLLAEDLGLFRNSHAIGFKQGWLTALVASGYECIGNTLRPIGNDVSTDSTSIRETSGQIERFRTALKRYGLSAPIQTLNRFGFFDKRRTFFDYGCGRGDDLASLKAEGITASGWDPFYQPTVTAPSSRHC